MNQLNNDTLFAKRSSIEEVKGNLLKKTKGDKFIWGIVILLALISVLVVYSATGSLAYKMNKGNNEVYLFKQLAFMVMGMLLIYFLHKINYTIFSRIATFLFYPLLAYTLFFGTRINDGSRWIRLPIINMSFQTSDFAKLALFMYLSKMLSKKQQVIKNFKEGFLPIIIPVALVCVLIAPANLSNALLTFATSLLLMFIGRVSIKHLLLVIAIAEIPLLVIVLVAVSTYKPVKSELAEKTNSIVKLNHVGRFTTWVKRVQDFIYSNSTDVTDQVQQAKIAIANGGILVGLGPGNSRFQHLKMQLIGVMRPIGNGQQNQMPEKKLLF
jgi:cell division protein FtsW